MLGLLDTGATGVFIKQNALSQIEHQIEQVSLKVKGRYSQSHLKQMATLIIKLPGFCGSCHITVCAYVEDNSC
jgi:hypothetical protein